MANREKCGPTGEAVGGGTKVKGWATLAYVKHRENLPAGPGPAIVRLNPSET